MSHIPISVFYLGVTLGLGKMGKICGRRYSNLFVDGKRIVERERERLLGKVC
jgi:hypothetical protein